MEIFLSWLFLAAVVGFIASNRGKNGILWFFISLVLSPLIGLILVLVLRSAPADEQDIKRRCPFCGEEVLAAAIKCKHCHSDIAALDAAALVDLKGAYFPRPESMSIGEYRERIIENNAVKSAAVGFEWKGRQFSSFDVLLEEIKNAS